MARSMHSQNTLQDFVSIKTESMVTPVFATPILTTSWLA
uniref:Glycerol dehydrogenase n=1 Tax=Klebsiella pneumoniae TaxID=573 RepID=A0A5P1PMB0_KLEPN|nr:Glycerol dehydrogenase [Klebsiella pneumoniae]QEQ70160.1 Glycerol dehydrogenase [Klebsiella pneumoniae]QEQ70376.1 Glycerol dehydrogenase [Klebsiella pneumoniae]